MAAATSNRKAMGKVIAKAWLDPEFLKQLKSDPKGTLAKEGIHVDAAVKVVEDTKDTVHLVIPVRPAELDDHIKKQKEHPGTCAQFCSLVPEFCSSAGHPTPDFCSL